MEFEYDELAGMGYLKLNEGKSVRTEADKSGHLLFDFDKDGNLLGVEVSASPDFFE